MFIANPHEVSTLRTGLRALYLPGSSTSTNTWPDSSGYGNTATVQGTTSWANSWNGRRALVLNGTGTATIPASSTLNAGTANVSFASWMYVRNAPPSGQSYLAHIFSNEGGTGGATSFRFGWGDNARKMRLTAVYYTGSHQQANNSVDTPLGEWLFVAVTTDGSKTRFYKNGLLETESNFTAVPNIGTNGYTIGGGAGRFFDGSIGLLAYYPKRTLSAAEVKGLYEWTK